MILYLKETDEIYGEPHVTRFIRIQAGMELREEEKGAVDLSSHFTKRKLYKLWVWSRRWCVISDNKGSYLPWQSMRTASTTRTGQSIPNPPLTIAGPHF
jgi:hypothetical protein